MKKAIISDAETVILILQDEIRRSYEARYDHRLHAVLMVAQGQSCNKVSQLLGDSPRAIAYWVSRFEAEGLSGLADADRPGRPSKLDEHQMRIVKRHYDLILHSMALKAIFGMARCSPISLKNSSILSSE